MKSISRSAPILLPALVILAFFAGLGLSPAPASAQDDAAKKKATAYYKQGTTNFKLGDFDEAIKYFKLAYETSPHHAFLFNLGQAYRQKGDCRQAIFFYKGYLAEAGSDAKNRDLVEQHIAELTEICAATEDSKNKPPDGALEPGSDDGDADGDDGDRVATAEPEPTDNSVSSGTSGREPTTIDTSASGPWQPHLLSASLFVGPALLDFGQLDVGGAQPSLGLDVGYPLAFGKLALTLGAGFTYTPVPWEQDNMTGTATLASVLANLGVRYAIMDKVRVGGDLGAGVLLLASLQSGDVFLPPGEAVSGTLSTMNIRAGLAVDYLLTDNLMVSAKPVVFSTSPTIDGLRDQVETFRRIEFLVGVGYRM